MITIPLWVFIVLCVLAGIPALFITAFVLLMIVMLIFGLADLIIESNDKRKERKTAKEKEVKVTTNDGNDNI